MKKIVYSMLAVILIVVFATASIYAAEPAANITSAELAKGGEATLTVSVSGISAGKSASIDLVADEGIEIIEGNWITKEGYEPDIKTNWTKDKEAVITFNLNSDYFVGDVLTVKVKAADGAVDGDYNVTCKVKVTYKDSEEAEIINATVVGKVTLKTIESRVASANLTLGEAINMVYSVELAPGDEAAKMRFVIYNGDGDATMMQEVDGVKNGDYYDYRLTGINPQRLGDKIVAELFVVKEGQKYSVGKAHEYSVLQYCKDVIEAGAENNKMTSAQFSTLKTLIADLMEYGAAAQDFKDYREEAFVNAEKLSTPSEFKPVDEVDADKILTSSVDGYKFISAYFEFTDLNRLVFKFEIPSVDKFKLGVNVNGSEKLYELSDESITNVSGNVYEFRTEALNISGMIDNWYTLNLYVEGKKVKESKQQLTYAFDTYVLTAQKNDTPFTAEMVTLTKALYNYGLSSLAYQNAMKAQ